MEPKSSLPYSQASATIIHVQLKLKPDEYF